MEQRKLQEFERRKALERERKKNKVAAHRKICSRTIAKSYSSGLLGSAVGYLRDVGYFTDTFQVEVLEQNVMPWLFEKVEGFVGELNTLGDFGDVFLGNNVEDFIEEHKKTVKLERDRKEAVRLAIEEAQKEKLEEKRKRKEAKELARKAAELKRLREEVNTLFVSKGEFKDGVLIQEQIEITGNHSRQPIIGALGGFLGTLAIVVSGAHLKAKQAGLEKVMLDARIIQNFLLLYIDQKMRTEKFTLQVGKAVEQFLNNLDKPLQLNEMRVMKESNYQRFRQILSDSTLFGDEILQLMQE